MPTYKVTLSKEERVHLTSIISKGSHTSQAYRNSYILLNVDKGSDSLPVTSLEISRILKVSPRTIDRVKKQFVEEGIESCLKRKTPTRVYDRKLDGETEARLISIACSEPPKGFAKWSLRLLADKMVELNYVESISHESVRGILKKTNLSLGNRRAG